MKTWQRLLGLLLAVILALTLDGLPNRPARAQNAPAAAQMDWLEPRGLSVVDLVGLVPEAHLRDSILAFTGGGGILQYVEGSRTGDQVTVHVKISPRFGSLPFTEFNCLGKYALFDEWPVIVPASQMRVFSAGIEVTDKLHPLLWYYPPGQVQPLGSAEGVRYVEIRDAPLTRLPNGAWLVPANMGCALYLPGSWTDLTAEFIFTAPQRIVVQVLASETFDFHSYTGPGDAGQLGSLSAQMESRFGKRHDKFELSVPSGADFVWVNFPPTPVSPYIGGDIEYNIRQPGSGTYRLAIGKGLSLSTDYTISEGLPLAAQYLDSDLTGGDFLPRLTGIDTLTGPEYFVPPGIAYDPCMKDGGCSDVLLQRIWDTIFPVSIHYYKVSRATDQLTSIPLRQVAKGWDAAAMAAALPSLKAATSATAEVVAETPPNPLDVKVRVALPIVYQSEYVGPIALPDVPPQAGCPCGWFDTDGRMLDVIPGP